MFKSNSVQVHWIPGNKNIKEKELADNLAKEAAEEMIGKPETYPEKRTKQLLSFKDIKQFLQGK